MIGAALRHLVMLATVSCTALAFGPVASAVDGGVQRDVVFTDYSPLAKNDEMARRLLSPLNQAKLGAALARAGTQLREEAVDLARERFLVYAPSHEPPQGYGVLVFVPPWSGEQLPEGWGPVLDQRGFIFVSAANSGNEASILGRRVPLALVAAQNIAKRYRVDPDRIYIGGFSGGSRVAMRIALGYPDVFHGALLNAGSDPVGDQTVPLPRRDLLRRFQDSTRIVYVTGEQDAINRDKDGASGLSMRAWCAFNLEFQVLPRVGHEVAGAQALAAALDVLSRPPRPDPNRVGACMAVIDTRLAAQIKALAASDRRDEARKRLERIDAQFGGLAASAVSTGFSSPNAPLPSGSN